MPVIAAPARRWSLGFWILVSFMVGIFALIIGILVLSIRPDLINTFGPLRELHSVPSDFDSMAALEWFRQGNLQRAKSAIQDCKPTDLACTYLGNEIEFFESDFDDSLIEKIASKTPNPDLQYLHALLLSNHFTNISEYTSLSFPKSVLFLYAASTAGHPGALMAMGYRHMNGYGVPKRCETAALNYLEVAKPIANIYANSVPKAVELVRLGVEKDKKLMTLPEISLFTEVANTNPEISLAVGKRYLLGTDGFPQDYIQAVKFLSLAATAGEPAVASPAWALLGYVHALGLGVEADAEKAEDMFQRGISDGLGMNGMGFLRFKADKYADAYALFNQSAAAGSSDGMFNLASLYLTGTGTAQNFQKAFMWFTEALRRGHTPAGYALAVMHLNGIGTVRDCGVAVSLLKEVAERGEYVAQTLRTAHAFLDKSETRDLGALQVLKLAEAGHQVSQENLAHLIDSGKLEGKLFPEKFSQTFAQRFYELAADQGSVTSELRLGDFAYYGWGLEAEFSQDSHGLTEIVHKEKTPDFHEARRRYVKARDEASKVASLTGGSLGWINRVVGTASFNLGYMHQFGIGTRVNPFEASRQYRRAIAKESHGAWLLEKIVDIFVHPPDIPEKVADVPVVVAREPSELMKKLSHAFRDYRVLAVLVLLGMLAGLVIVKYFILP